MTGPRDAGDGAAAGDARPPDSEVVAWSYPYGQYELAVLARVVHDGFAANRHVDYSPNWGVVSGRASFRGAPAGPGRLTLRATGAVRVLTDGRPAAVADRSTLDADGETTVTVPAGTRQLLVEVRTPPGTPPAVAVTGGDVRLATGWETWTEAWGWGAATTRAGDRLRPAHLVPAPVTEVEVDAVDGLVALPAPVLGRPVLDGPTEPVVSSGESAAEARAGAGDHQETRHDVVRRPDGRWTTRHALGFRYLQIQPPVTGRVGIEVPDRPPARPARFRCSDEVLTRIWEVSADTLDLCLQELAVDGIKRDRMPWAGDLATATLSSAYALRSRGGVVRDTWVALGQPRYGHVNGIGDYTLWWLVVGDLHLRHLDGHAERAQVAAHLDRVLTDLLPEVADDGVFRPRTHPGQFAPVFLDWGATVAPDRDSTALQMLWSWALTSAVRVLTDAGHPSADRWAELARTLAATLRTHAWEPATGTWREYLGPSDPSSPYPNLFAVLAGMHDGPLDPVRDVLLEARVGTPFLTGFALRALGLAGARPEAVGRLRRQWGPMLDRGARTFWEEFPDGGDDLAMYGRPFGRSLCHGWASGPAALLPELVLGLRPVGDGWSEFTVDPCLGDLDWAEAVVPLTTGDLVVHCGPDGLVVDVPPSCLLVHGSDRRGPGKHRL